MLESVTTTLPVLSSVISEIVRSGRVTVSSVTLEITGSGPTWIGGSGTGSGALWVGGSGTGAASAGVSVARMT